MAAKLNLPALRAFADSITKDPSVLFAPELDFLRSALSQFGDLRAPPKTSPTDHGHGHSHATSHAHEHDHSNCSGHHEGSHKVHEEDHRHHDHEVEEEDRDEEDAEHMDPESEATLAVPTGGEGLYMTYYMHALL